LGLPVFGSSTLIEYPGSFFSIIQFDSESPKHQLKSSVPGLLFVNLDGDVWNRDHIKKTAVLLPFPFFDMAQSARDRRTRHPSRE
jgi:hypothetical protein